MTNPDEVIDVDTEALRAAAESLAAGAQHLQEGLKKLDAEVLEMLATWTGVAGGSYRPAWQQWHSGATQVQAALTRIAGWLDAGGLMFESNEDASAQALNGVHGG
ncbi:WXG100 family type VII secretion target [[Mycobacterium] burgundiense]|uniref:ESAT-6-like protein n=1 Tax=[Mycobacterium] burgundiense TaxID=3064286 RepID=A0ABM9M3G5_9MYCO|nr:WXG100 family type VII secretion target [Mycolicibacterium sp. MU0053]CAJ1509569.1 WXG100 family type VII secretion target [Mycolicibacterium sp. MU0053]